MYSEEGEAEEKQEQEMPYTHLIDDFRKLLQGGAHYFIVAP